MGEEFPLDPNQVEPPQDGQFEQQQGNEEGHIDVEQKDDAGQSVEVTQASSETSASVDDNGFRDDGTKPTYIEDQDKAQEMAEAGDKYRTEAKENRENTNGNNSYRYQNYGSSIQSKTPGERAELFNEWADKAEQSAGELYDEAKSSDYTHNADKAKKMILADRERKGNLAADTPKEAGNKYEREAANEQMGKTQAEALKDVSDHNMARIFLRYSKVIAENYRKHGDELTLNLKALEMVAGSLGYSGGTQEYEFGKYVTITVNSEKGGAVDIVTSGRNIGSTTEKWHVPMFDDDPAGDSYNGTYARPRDFAYYERTELASDTDGEFDKVQTKSTRSLGNKDLDNLSGLFGKVSKYEAMEISNTLYPGDDGYGEALAEINYGRE
jgi:hypothetical protein